MKAARAAEMRLWRSVSPTDCPAPSSLSCFFASCLISAFRLRTALRWLLALAVGLWLLFCFLLLLFGYGVPALSYPDHFYLLPCFFCTRPPLSHCTWNYHQGRSVERGVCLIGVNPTRNPPAIRRVRKALILFIVAPPPSLHCTPGITPRKCSVEWGVGWLGRHEPDTEPVGIVGGSGKASAWRTCPPFPLTQDLVFSTFFCFFLPWYMCM